MRSAGLVLLLACVLLLGQAGPARAEFVIETVDADASCSYQTSVLVDEAGNPHIAYVDGSGVRYAYKTGNTWTFETASGMFPTSGTSMCFTSAGDVHIYFGSGSAIYQGVRNHVTGLWTVSSIASGYDWGGCSAAIGSDGIPRVAYAFEPGSHGPRALKYGWYEEGVGWHWETADTLASWGNPGSYLTGLYPSLRLDSGNQPRIAYIESDPSLVIYAAKAGGTWTYETVDTLSQLYQVSLGIDGSDRPHIAYNWLRKAKYAANLGGGWSHSVVDSIGGNNYLYISLRVTSSGFPRIAYRDYLGGEGLKYALRDAPGEPWTKAWVDSGYVIGQLSCLALSNDDRPFISYIGSASDLRLARWEDIEVWHVPADAPTIAAALDSAGVLDTIEVAAGTYVEHDLVLKQGVYMRSEPRSRGSVTIDANQLGRIFWSSFLDETTVVDGFILESGHPGSHGGAVFIEHGSPVFRNCVFLQNVAGTPGSGHDGGAAYCQEASPLFEDCSFLDNEAADKGAAVFCKYQGTPRFERCVFANNSTSSVGGGVYCYSFVHAEFDGCTFYGNSGAGAGGVSADGYSHAMIENSILSFSASGAGVSCDPTGNATVICTDVYGNAGGDWVGCISGLAGIDGNFSADPLFCDAGGGDFTLHADSPCSPDWSPGTCGLVGALGVGCQAVAGVVETPPAVPVAAFLRAARPNPFNPTTTIAFGIPRAGRVRIAVHDVAGAEVAVLIDEEMAPGEYAATWDGRDAAGRPVPSGLYFARMQAGDFSEARRLVLIR